MEELEGMIFSIYDDFKLVMQQGDSQQKRRALLVFLQFQIMLKDQIEEYEKAKGIDYKRIEKILKGMKGEFFERCEQFKQKAIEYQNELEPLIEKAKEEVETPQSSRKRKSKMEKRLRVKE
jgi:hypothetical protein